MSKSIDLTGQRFGNLTVIKRDYSRVGRTLWLCQCDCGNQKPILSYDLRVKGYKTCGCARYSRNGLSRHKLMSVWTAMNRRCYFKDSEKYSIYGGRGIAVCDEWQTDFIAFFNWCIDNGWDEGLQLDRENNDGNYEPSNCRFIISVENIRNSRVTKLNSDIILEIRNAYNNKMLGLSTYDIANGYGISQSSAHRIISGNVWAGV